LEVGLYQVSYCTEILQGKKGKRKSYSPVRLSNEQTAHQEQKNKQTKERIMRAFLFGTVAAIALTFGVTANASAGWIYRDRVRFEHGHRCIVRERVWVPDVVVTPPVCDDIPVVMPPVVVDPPIYYGGFRTYYRPGFYRPIHHRH
jgi:hypothetical protein